MSQGQWDFRPSEVAIAFVLALSVLVAAYGAMDLTSVGRTVDVSESDKTNAVPVKVKPVLDMDSALLKLGGAAKDKKFKLPEMWQPTKPQPKEAKHERQAFVSKSAGQTAEDIPPPEVRVADAGTEPPPPDASFVDAGEKAEEAVPDAGGVAAEGPGHAEGVKEGTKVDPLADIAIEKWKIRIIGWIRGPGLKCPGVPPEELKKLRATASVSFSGDGTVTGYTMGASGNAELDSAARARLEAIKGSAIPPPPDNVQVSLNSIGVAFVCSQ